MNEKEKEDARLSIKDLLINDLPDEIEGTDNPNVALSKKDTSKDIDVYEKIQEKTYKRATKTIDSLLKFYLSEDIIEEEEYIRAKIEIDKLSLSKLLFLMETSERSIKRLMETIDDGELHPRMFEVLGGLQKTLLDIIKSQTMFMVASEESMKRLSRDVDIYGKDSSKDKIKGQKRPDIISSRGTKGIIKAIKEMGSEEGRIEDSKSE